MFILESLQRSKRVGWKDKLIFHVTTSYTSLDKIVFKFISVDRGYNTLMIILVHVG